MMIRRGFTLLETLIALALMIALLYAFFQFMSSSSTAQAVTREGAARQLYARTLCDMIERDLMWSLVGDVRNGAGVQGTATELHVLTRAVSAALAIDGVADRFALVDLEKSGYVFDESRRAVTIERALPAKLRRATDDSTSLAARRTMDDDDSLAAPGNPPERESIAPIERMRFRYFDGSSWQDSFDSLSSNRLPVIVEVSLWLRPLPKPPAEALEEEMALTRDAFEEPEALFDEEAHDDPAVDAEFSEEEDDVPAPDVVRIVSIPDARAGGRP